MTGGVDERHREGCAGALAEPKAEIEERSEAEVVEDDCVPGLDRSMGGDEPERKLRAEAGGDEGRRSGDESVDDNGNARRRGPQRQSDEQRDLEAADRSEHTDRIRPVRVIDLEAALDHGDLVPPRCIVEAGAATGNLEWGQARQRGDDPTKAQVFLT